MNPCGCLIHMMPSMDICISSVIMHKENQNSPEKVQTFISKVFCSVITARKRSLGQGNNFTPVCHSVHRGGYLSMSCRSYDQAAVYKQVHC